MEQLSRRMQAAAADPPPTAIDLDQLVAGERRRERYRYVAGVAAGTAMLVAGAVSVPVALSGSGSGQTAGAPPGDCPTVWYPPETPSPSAAGDPAGSPDGSAPTTPGRSTSSVPAPDPSPTFGTPATDCRTLVGRLDAALTTGMHRWLPDAVLVNADPHERPGLFHRDVDRSYRVYVRLGEAVLEAQVGLSDAYTRGLCPAPPIPSCTETTVPGAHLVGGVEPGKYGTHIEGVIIAKQDGTEVRLMLYIDEQNYHQPYPDLPLTVDQLRAIGMDPGFTV
jgi:hypothetical protein